MNQSQSLRILRQNKRNYNTIAKEWDISRGRPSALKLKLIKSAKRDWQALDLGCGNGFLAPEIVKQGAYYTGLDISSKLLFIAKKRYSSLIKEGKVKFILGDALKLPFKNNSFDFIFSYAVLHHIPSSELRIKFFKEAYRVLKPGGKAVIDNWNLLNEWERKKYMIDEQLNKIHEGYDQGDVYVPWKATRGKAVSRYVHIFSDKELRSLAVEAGFKKIKIQHFNRSGEIKNNGEAIVITAYKS